MKIVAALDLHGFLPQLPAADIIRIVGDITSDDYRKDGETQWKWYDEVYLPCGEVKRLWMYLATRRIRYQRMNLI